MEQAASKAPLHQLATIEGVGEVAAFLVSDAARHITGKVQFVDCCDNIAVRAGFNSWPF